MEIIFKLKKSMPWEILQDFGIFDKTRKPFLKLRAIKHGKLVASTASTELTARFNLS